jgi:hypothetical protein
MILPEKSYFNLSEISNQWSCSEDHVIQLGASNKLLIIADFGGYVIVEGVYKDIRLPEKFKFGQTIGRLFSFDINFNSPIVIHAPNIENKYFFQFKVPRKDQVKVYLHRAFCDQEKPMLLELNKHYDVDTLNNYVQMLVGLAELDTIAIVPDIVKWLEDIDVRMSAGFEQLRCDDLRRLIVKNKVQVEYLQPSTQGYFKCIAEGKDQVLPWVSRNDLYVSFEEKNRFEKDNLNPDKLPNKSAANILKRTQSTPKKRAPRRVPELLNLARNEIGLERQFTGFSNMMIKDYIFDKVQKDIHKINQEKYYNLSQGIEEGCPYNLYVIPSEGEYVLHYTTKRGGETVVDNKALTTLQGYFTEINTESKIAIS